MSLATGRRLHRKRWTALPMPEDAIQRVNELARAQGMPRTLTFGDRTGVELTDMPHDVDDDHDSDYAPEEDRSGSDTDSDGVTYDSEIADDTDLSDDNNDHGLLPESDGDDDDDSDQDRDTSDDDGQQEAPGARFGTPASGPAILPAMRREPDDDVVPELEDRSDDEDDGDDDSSDSESSDSGSESTDHNDDDQSDDPDSADALRNAINEPNSSFGKRSASRGSPGRSKRPRRNRRAPQRFSPGTGEPASWWGETTRDQNTQPTSDDHNTSSSQATESAGASDSDGHTASQAENDAASLLILKTAMAEQPLGMLFLTEQMSAKRGLKLFGKDGADAIVSEMRQLHIRKTIKPVEFKDLTRDQKSCALRYLMFLNVGCNV